MGLVQNLAGEQESDLNVASATFFKKDRKLNGSLTVREQRLENGDEINVKKEPSEGAKLLEKLSDKIEEWTSDNVLEFFQFLKSHSSRKFVEAHGEKFFEMVEKLCEYFTTLDNQHELNQKGHHLMMNQVLIGNLFPDSPDLSTSCDAAVKNYEEHKYTGALGGNFEEYS